LAAALRAVRTDVFASRRGARDSTVAKLVVVVTRAPSMNETETVAEARRLRADGVDIVGVGVGDAVSRSELDGVVSYPMDRNALYVDDYSQLSSYVSRLVSIQCNGTLDPPATYSPAYLPPPSQTSAYPCSKPQPKVRPDSSADSGQQGFMAVVIYE